jgi:hypothetical protein
MCAIGAGARPTQYIRPHVNRLQDASTDVVRTPLGARRRWVRAACVVNPVLGQLLVQLRQQRHEALAGAQLASRTPDDRRGDSA